MACLDYYCSVYLRNVDLYSYFCGTALSGIPFALVNLPLVSLTGCRGGSCYMYPTSICRMLRLAVPQEFVVYKRTSGAVIRTLSLPGCCWAATPSMPRQLQALGTCWELWFCNTWRAVVVYSCGGATSSSMLGVVVSPQLESHSPRHFHYPPQELMVR